VPFNLGDYVRVKRQEERTDDQISYIEIIGKVVDRFNVWDNTGDHWRYWIQDNVGNKVSFYEGIDKGEIVLAER